MSGKRTARASHRRAGMRGLGNFRVTVAKKLAPTPHGEVVGRLTYHLHDAQRLLGKLLVRDGGNNAAYGTASAIQNSKRSGRVLDLPTSTSHYRTTIM